MPYPNFLTEKPGILPALSPDLTISSEDGLLRQADTLTGTLIHPGQKNEQDGMFAGSDTDADREPGFHIKDWTDAALMLGNLFKALEPNMEDLRLKRTLKSACCVTESRIRLYDYEAPRDHLPDLLKILRKLKCTAPKAWKTTKQDETFQLMGTSVMTFVLEKTTSPKTRENFRVLFATNRHPHKFPK